MKSIKSFRLLTYLLLIILVGSCNEVNNNLSLKDRYKIMLSKLKHRGQSNAMLDSNNLIDSKDYDPNTYSLNKLLVNIEVGLRADSLIIAKKNKPNETSILTAVDSQQIENSSMLDTSILTAEDEKQIEIKNLKFNLTQVHQHITDSAKIDSANSQMKMNDCKQKECKVWAQIIKSKQLLFLYIEGSLTDSFKVSTGAKDHETPNMNRRPNGPIFKRYTSKKFPGGNYDGLGNMPYAVFINGGYAIHGTTRGNIPKLGTKASHGCIRLHPDHAKIFSALVTEVGLSQTWISIEN